MPPPNDSANPLVKSSGLPFPVVGLGASAGGLSALTKVFEGLPASTGMAFVIVMHLSPKHESSAAEILQKVTGMTVKQVKGATPIEANHVYVIPPTRGLAMYDGQLSLTELERDRGRHIVIDLFFRTLADAHKERAIAVVLSGTGADGAVGIGEIKEQGGVVLSQSVDDAEFDGMPASAIATGKVDIVLPASEIPQRLLELWRNAQKIELPAAEETGIQAREPTSPESAEKALRHIMQTLQSRTGHDFKHYKRATVLRRIERRLQVNSLSHLPAYEKYLESHPQETALLLSDMLIGVTNFFRDRQSFEAVERIVVPDLFSEATRDQQLRVWVPGCSTGEEAYSLLMLICQERTGTPHKRPVQIFASDIDETALAKGREGKYPASIIADIPPTLLRTWMQPETNEYRVSKVLREMVLFAQHNALRDPPFSRLDLISCRNLLIYLEREVQRELFQMFHFALRPGGYLFLGGSETADVANRLFVPVDKKHRIYRAVSSIRAVRALPRFPLGGPDNKPTVVTTNAEPAPKLSVAALHDKLLKDYAPPSILLKPDGEILHTSRVEHYLRFAPGVPTQHILTAIQPELRPAVRTALFQATQTSHVAQAETARVQRDGHFLHVSVWVQPVEGEWPERLLLLTIEETPDQSNADRAGADAGARDPVLHNLEAELQRKDTQLQEVIAQYESSVEDLKSANEELQAINEELRSATEELETSKEELQSTNEELFTVNSELKLKVEETAEINDDLQNLMSSTGIATVFVDRDLRIKRFTPAASAIFNVIAADVGRSLLDITHRLDYAKLSEDAQETFRSLRMVEREIASSDGQWYLSRMLPYRTADDRIHGAVLTFIDITSRHAAQRSVEIDQERMHLIASSMPDFSIITLDEDGNFTSWSAGAERLFGYTESEVMGRSSALIYTPEDRANHVPEKEMREADATGRALDERWHLRKDGSRVFLSGIMAPMRLGRTKGFAKIARDMTANARTEATRALALSSAVSEANTATQASELKDQFLAILSHELKHPLNLIQINVQLLLALPESSRLPSVVKIGDTIQKTVRSQARIIDDLLDVSRTRAGKLVLNLMPINLADALQSSFAWTAQQASERGLQFSVDVSEQALTIQADSVRIEQVAMNLLGNAIKFTPRGGKIAARLYPLGRDAVFEIADTGRGIARSFLPHIFELFKQSDPLTTREQGGLGIGLALVHDIVTLHGGSTHAESSGEGKGTTMTVRLPLCISAELPAAKRASDDSAVAGVRILYVDDDADTRELFASLLRIQGAHVVTAESGSQALVLVEDNEVDLVISDIGMPRMNGYELISELRKRPGTASVPAIALTGYGRPQDVELALQSGFTAHLDKPVELERLQSLVRDLFQRPQ